MAGLLDAVIRSAARPAAQAARPGIKVFHSSPYDFDRFDLSKLGAGQGAQMYGRGLYFAENPKVSGQGGEYWKEFLQRFGGPERSAASRLQEAGFDRDKAIALAQRDIAQGREALPSRIGTSMEDLIRKATASQEEQIKLLQSGKPVGPRTYEVNINARPDEFLNWNKPLAQQPVGGAVWDTAKKWLYGNPETLTGMEVYKGMEAIEGPKVASNVLRDAGVPGVQYRDAASRNLEEKLAKAREDYAYWPNPGNHFTLRKLEQMTPTNNYVVNDDTLLDIMKKYSVPGMLGMTGAGAGAQQAPWFPPQQQQVQ